MPDKAKGRVGGGFVEEKAGQDNIIKQKYISLHCLLANTCGLSNSACFLLHVKVWAEHTYS